MENTYSGYKKIDWDSSISLDYVEPVKKILDSIQSKGIKWWCNRIFETEEGERLKVDVIPYSSAWQKNNLLTFLDIKPKILQKNSFWIEKKTENGGTSSMELEFDEEEWKKDKHTRLVGIRNVIYDPVDHETIKKKLDINDFDVESFLEDFQRKIDSLPSKSEQSEQGFQGLY